MGGEMDRGERATVAVLASVSGFGAREFGRGLSRVETVQEIWEADDASLAWMGYSKAMVRKILKRKAEVEPDKYLESLEARGIGVLSVLDGDYPPKLREIQNPPFVLFIRGRLPSTDRPWLAVVGTRKPTAYGEWVVEKLVAPVAAQGVVIVSGLAFGIDALAHRVTLEVGGQTVAILGGGVDKIQPSGNKKLGERIIKERGAVASEYSPESEVLKQNFVIRNRIVAGACWAVLVVQGTSKSGTLVTAREANKEGRLVLAVPGPLDSEMSEAPNSLIQQGAGVVLSANDILERLGVGGSARRKAEMDLSRLSDDQRKVWEALTEAKDLSLVSREIGVSVGELTGVVTLMELAGLVVVEGGVVRRKV